MCFPFHTLYKNQVSQHTRPWLNFQNLLHQQYVQKYRCSTFQLHQVHLINISYNQPVKLPKTSLKTTKATSEPWGTSRPQKHNYNKIHLLAKDPIVQLHNKQPSLSTSSTSLKLEITYKSINN